MRATGKSGRLTPGAVNPTGTRILWAVLTARRLPKCRDLARAAGCSTTAAHLWVVRLEALGLVRRVPGREKSGAGVAPAGRFSLEIVA